MNKPLDGITVLDVTEVWAGPMATSLLGDLGARVIKIESYPRASMTRLPGSTTSRGYMQNDPSAPKVWDRQAIHNMANRNKYTVTLNLAHAKGIEVFNKLIKISDVFVEAYSSGTLEKLGISYGGLKELQPDLIMVSANGWGVEGPYQGYVTLGSSLEAFTGHQALRGYPDSDPTRAPVVQHTDTAGASTMAFAVLVALHHRAATGEGQWLDISQVEGFLPHMARPLMDCFMNGRVPGPMGNRDYHMAPHGCYRCKGEDNWLVITVSNDDEWHGLCRGMGNPQWAEDERFATGIGRYHRQDDLDSRVQQWTLQQDKLEAMHMLQSLGVPAQAVLDDVDMFADPNLEARGFYQVLPHPRFGDFIYPGFLWKMNGMDWPIDMPPGGLGEHNNYVYGALLGMSKREIAELESSGLIGEELVEQEN